MVETENLVNHTPLDYTKESVKITRNSKGYTWEYKTIGTGKDGIFTDEDFLRMKNREEEISNQWKDLE